MRKLGMVLLGAAVAFSFACGANSSTEGSSSEVAASVVSGALNNTSGSAIGLNDLKEHKSKLERFWDAVQPIGTAWAASWSCSGGSLSPTFDGPAGNPYTFTPVQCSVNWGSRSATSKWSGTFTLNYGASCDATHAWIENQVAGCSVTRTTATGGNTRTVTGPNGNAYAVTHDTNGAGSGWDSTVTPAPTDDGLVVTCAAGGCSAGKSLVINGSHLTATETPSGGSATKIWDHTLTTGADGLSVTGEGTSRVVSGSVTVQHNLAKVTATATFNSVGYGEAGCCFPTTGSITTTFLNGNDKSKTETLTFSDVCGDASLTTAAGSTESITLQHCM